MSNLTEREYRQLKGYLQEIRRGCTRAEHALEEASSILIGVEDRGAKWAASLHVEMGEEREPISIVEEKARTTWKQIIEANK